MIDFGVGLANDGLTLVAAVIKLVAVISVVGVYWRTRAAAPTLGALVLAGAVIWGVNNVGWFEQKVGEETSLAPVVRTLPAASS